MKEREFAKNVSLLKVGGVFRPADAASGVGRDGRFRTAVIFLSVTGHTASLAEAAARAAGADLFRLVPQPPYPDARLDAAREVGREQKTGIVRAVRCPPFEPADYDALIVLTPTWNGRVAGPFAAWLKARNLQGRLAVTGSTHGGGGVMKTRSDLRAALPGVRLGTHLAVFGSVAPRDERVISRLRENGLTARR